MEFQPDYRMLVDAVTNKRPRRLPLYEHIISPKVMEKALDKPFAHLLQGDKNDLREFFTHYCRFFKEMTFDTVSFEFCTTHILPEGGALKGGKPGPIQTRADFEKYPWEKLPHLFWQRADMLFQALSETMPPGMKAIGGIGNGIFETSEDLVGLMQLPFMQLDDPDLFDDLYNKIGDLFINLWTTFLERYSGVFAICRFGDDLGFRTSTLTTPTVIRKNIIPQYKRVIDLIHSAGKPFLWHSCGCIFEIMDDVIETGIDAKHSNEDAIAPFGEWIHRYNDRIGLIGGFDVDLLCQQTPEAIFETVLQQGTKYRQNAKGFALGSGNSIPEYVPLEGFLAMVHATQQIRKNEQ